MSIFRIFTIAALMLSHSAFADEVISVPSWVVDGPPSSSSTASVVERNGRFRVEMFGSSWDEFLQVLAPYLKAPVTYDPALLDGKKISFVADFASSDSLERSFSDFARSHGLVIVNQGGIRSLVPFSQAKEAYARLTGTVPLQHVAGSTLLETLRGMFPDATFHEAPNQLVFSAPPYQVDEVRATVLALDVFRPNVHIEAIVFESTTAELERLGVNLSAMRGDFSVISTPALPGLFTAAIASRDLSLALEALQSSTGTEVLSRPSLTLSDRETGSILVGQDIPLVTGSVRQEDGQLFQTIQRRQVGTSLALTPELVGSMIRLKLRQEVSRVSPANEALADVTIDTRNLEVVTQVEDGAVVLLGGLVSRSNDSVRSGVPVLSSLPLVGKLFSYRSDSKADTVLNLLVRVKRS